MTEFYSWRGREMGNLSMWRKLIDKMALDVRAEGHEVMPGVFRLARFVEDVDYCDGLGERWVWSIGRRLEDGAIFASVGTEFYQNPEFDCIFLR